MKKDRSNTEIRSSKSSVEFYYNRGSPGSYQSRAQDFRPSKIPTSPIDPKKIRVYSPEFILSLKPKSIPIEIPKEYQLKSTGYVILKQFEESVDSKKEPVRKLNMKPKQQQLTLRIHEGRFIPSIMRKKYVEGDEDEERKFAVQTCLNRLNFKNSADIIKDLKELQASNELIINLLLDRAAVDEDMPEKNSHLRNFAQFAIQIASQDNNFKLACQEKSLDKYNELINKKNQELNINVIECLIVWISYLVMGKVIKRKQYFRCLELAVKRQPPDTAVDIIRASYFTCGKFLDDQKWYECSTFYSYIFRNRPSTGYLLFLREDLFNFRDSGWNEQFFNQNQNDNAANKEEIKSNDNLFAKNSFNKNENEQLQKVLRDKLLDDYTNWHEDPEFGTPRVPRQAKLKDVVNAVILNFASEQTKIQPEIEDYSAWFGLLIRHAEIDNKELPGLLQEAVNQAKDKNSPEYDEFMIGFFTILGGLYEEEQINFSSIVSLGVLSKPEYIDAVGRVTYIDQKEITDSLYPSINNSNNNNNSVSTFHPTLSSIASAPISPVSLKSFSNIFDKDKNKWDNSTIASLVTVTFRSENGDKTTEYGRAVDFSGIVYSALEENEEASDPMAAFDGYKKDIIEASTGMSKELITEVWNKIISSSQVTAEFRDKAINYFHENILKSM
ncbi:hypothetical protein M9Y10_004886 [Tritrichomonas musculus]|uniref:SBF1/SBF2 domain-containing protein n=1 Tax=Tritrichomonas musculus TaxID=1915356 RepID=A0ABR2JLM0_9EUKA